MKFLAQLAWRSKFISYRMARVEVLTQRRVKIRGESGEFLANSPENFYIILGSSEGVNRFKNGGNFGRG